MFADPRSVAVLLLAPFLLCRGLSAAPADDRPADISPAANVDENLFVVRALAREYNQWPENAWDGKAALTFCEEGRVRVKFLRSIAVRHELDAGIRGMCDDFLTLIDEYESSLAQLGEIDTEARKKAFEDALNTFVVGAVKGLKAGVDADAEGKRPLQVDVAVGKALVNDGLIEFIKHSRERDAETGNSASAEKSRFEKVLSFAEDRNHAAALGMTDRHHWAQAEAGFDPATSDRPLEELVKLWPRDPFVKLELAATGIDDKTSADSFIERARLCLDAVRLIPADGAFDGYRNQCLSSATEYACNAAEPGIDKTYRDAPTPHSQEAINITQAMLKADPEDGNRWVHTELFRALSAAGRFDEAVQAAQPVLDSPWKDRLAFTIRYARVMGVRGDADGLERWLRVSYILGFSDLKFVQESGDFDCLRTQKPQAYAELTTVKGATSIAFGLVDDDVVVKNRSPFPMTNLKMKFTVIKGGQIWTKERVLPFVAANSEETLISVFMIPGSQYDHYRWWLESDQGKLSSEDE